MTKERDTKPGKQKHNWRNSKRRRAETDKQDRKVNMQNGTDGQVQWQRNGTRKERDSQKKRSFLPQNIVKLHTSVVIPPVLTLKRGHFHFYKMINNAYFIYLADFFKKNHIYCEIA